MNYKEEDLRKAYKAGFNRCKELELNGDWLAGGLTEDGYIDSLKPKEKEQETVPITYGVLKRKINWGKLHTLIGVGYYALNEGFEIKDTEIFEIPLSEAENYNLI